MGTNEQNIRDKWFLERRIFTGTVWKKLKEDAEGGVKDPNDGLNTGKLDIDKEKQIATFYQDAYGTQWIATDVRNQLAAWGHHRFLSKTHEPVWRGNLLLKTVVEEQGAWRLIQSAWRRKIAFRNQFPTEKIKLPDLIKNYDPTAIPLSLKNLP